MATVVLAVLVALGLTLVLVQHVVQRRTLRRPALPAAARRVSILRPVCGADQGLADNLRSLLLQDHPDAEVIVGAADANDPALKIARSVAAEFPRARMKVVHCGPDHSANPKVSNLIALARHATGDLFLISDSNVRAPRNYVSDITGRGVGARAGLASSPIVARPNGSLGAAFESLHINTFLNGGVATMTQLLGAPCVVGKSMLLPRTMLEEIGGFGFLGQFLAEDQVGGEEVASRGHPIVLSPVPVENVLGRFGVRRFAARHVRWARIRRWICPTGYAFEPLLNPVAVATVGALALGTASAGALLVTAVLLKAVVDLCTERLLAVRRPVWHYLWLVPAKDLLVAALWTVPWFGRTVAWRGKRFELGPRTRLTRLPAEEPAFDVAPTPGPRRLLRTLLRSAAG